MSNETTNPVLIRILIGICVVSLCVVGAFVLLMTPSAKAYRAASKLKARGFEIVYDEGGYLVWQHPIQVWGEDQSITEDDCRLICQLPHLVMLSFEGCDLSGLNLDDIGNCRKLEAFRCYDVTQFPANEIRKLAACPISEFVFDNACLNDSNLEVFAKWTTIDDLHLDWNDGITDAGFEHLEKIAPLKYLDFVGTSVTEEGLEEFKKKRPDVLIRP